MPSRTSNPSKAPLIPRDTLFGNPDRVMPRLSPDGKLIAYLAPHNGVLNVFVRSLNKRDDRVVTNDTKRGIRIFFWQPDSQHVLYIQDKEGDENWHLYQTDIVTAQTRDLTPFEGSTVQPLALDHKRPDEMLISVNLRDKRLHDVYRLYLRTGTLVLDTENPGDVFSWSADHNLTVRAAQVFLPDGSNEIRYRPDAGSDWKPLLKWGPAEQFGGVAGFTPDNKRLLVITSVDANAARLVEVDPESGEQRVIAEDKQFDVSSVLTHPRTNELEGVAIVREKLYWKLFDPRVRKHFQTLRQVRRGEVQVVSRDLKDAHWIVCFSSDNEPDQYFTYNCRSGKARLLFSSRTELEKYKLARMRPISFTARDGMRIYGYLTLPYGERHSNLPMVLLVHGGPYGRDVWGLNNAVQWLANRGYAVLQINFRGSTGYGKDYVNAGNREWGGKMHTDLLDGKEWAVKLGYADPERVCIYGGSYGGYAALVGAAFTPEEFACAVDIVGPSNIVTLLRTIPPYWEPARALWNLRVGNIDTEVEFLESRSPLFKADRITKPLLIAQGANDPRVKQAESDQIVAAMRRNRKPVEYLVFADEGHGFALPANRFKFYAAAEQFLAEHLGGRAEPPAPAEEWESLKR